MSASTMEILVVNLYVMSIFLG